MSEDIGKPPPRGFLKAYTKVNVFIYRLSKGKMMNAVNGNPICLITMTGAKSGQKRTIPLMYVPYEGKFALVASQGGADTNPLWYKNLKKNPNIEIEFEGKVHSLVARELEGEEREKVWPTCVEYWPEYELYTKRTERVIPVFLCE